MPVYGTTPCCFAQRRTELSAQSLGRRTIKLGHRPLKSVSGPSWRDTFTMQSHMPLYLLVVCTVSRARTNSIG